MHSPLDRHEMDDYVRRLNAQLRRMPPQERAEVHQELRSHLDALIAAHEELGASPEQAVDLALRSFGDPARIGRRMYWEWRRSQWRGLSEDMKAVLTMLGLLAVSAIVLPSLTLGLLLIPYLLWHWTPEVGNFLEALLLVGVPVLAGSILGRRRPKQAVCGAFYGTVALTSMPWVISLTCVPWTQGFSPFMEISLWAGCWLAFGCAAAHLSSRVRGRQRQFRLYDFWRRRLG